MCAMKGSCTWKMRCAQMTSLPAQVLRVSDRGLLREGNWADIVVLDPDRVRDHATFAYPKQYPIGVDHIRQFLPLLLETITPHATTGGKAVLAAWEFLHRLERNASAPMHEAPLRIVTPAWWRLVVRPDKTIDRRAYTFCALQATHAAFKRHDLYVVPSQRWGDPRAELLAPEAWQAQRTAVCRMLGLSEQPAPVLERLAKELDSAYRRTADDLPINEAVHIERVHGRQELVLSGLDKLDEPPSLVALRTLVAQRLPRVELPVLLLEVQAWTGFASDFTYVSEQGARADDLPISVCAVLLAEACNVGLEPLVRPEIPALTRARLAWIQVH